MNQRNEHEHIQGASDAPIELIEYADFECPYCAKAYYVVKKIQEEFGNNLKFIFKNFPLVELHPYALHAALATEAAGAQGKFWEMHDILFENQESLEDSDILRYAKAIGLDFNQEEYYQKVKDDYNSGLNKGLNGTPAFFVNGKEYEGNWMSRKFVSYLRSCLN